MKSFSELFGILFISIIVVSIFIGCSKGINTKPKCHKYKIQMADISNQYKECKGLPYEGKEEKEIK